MHTSLLVGACSPMIFAAGAEIYIARNNVFISIFMCDCMREYIHVSINLTLEIQISLFVGTPSPIIITAGWVGVDPSEGERGLGVRLCVCAIYTHIYK